MTERFAIGESEAVKSTEIARKATKGEAGTVIAAAQGKGKKMAIKSEIPAKAAKISKAAAEISKEVEAEIASRVLTEPDATGKINPGMLAFREVILHSP